MRILQRKSDGALHVTALEGKLSDREEFTKETVASWTTLDFIALVALTTFLQGLSHALLTDVVNPREKDD